MWAEDLLSFHLRQSFPIRGEKTRSGTQGFGRWSAECIWDFRPKCLMAEMIFVCFFMVNLLWVSLKNNQVTLNILLFHSKYLLFFFCWLRCYLSSTYNVVLNFIKSWTRLNPAAQLLGCALKSNDLFDFWQEKTNKLKQGRGVKELHHFAQVISPQGLNTRSFPAVCQKWKPPEDDTEVKHLQGNLIWCSFL